MLQMPSQSDFIDGRVPITLEVYDRVPFFRDSDIPVFLNYSGIWKRVIGIYNSASLKQFVIEFEDEPATRINHGTKFFVYVSKDDFELAQTSNEKYWVSSDSEIPLKIYFNRQDAINSTARYLDSFDEEGLPVRSYKLVDLNLYTTDF
jgi:hypothetical protein